MRRGANNHNGKSKGNSKGKGKGNGNVNVNVNVNVGDKSNCKLQRQKQRQRQMQNAGVLRSAQNDSPNLCKSELLYNYFFSSARMAGTSWGTSPMMP
jgi:hypothetical protein